MVFQQGNIPEKRIFLTIYKAALLSGFLFLVKNGETFTGNK